MSVNHGCWLSVVCGCGVALQAGAYDVVFFRVADGGTHEVELEEDGALVLSSKTSEGEVRIQFAGDLKAWADYARVQATGGAQRVKVFDPSTPESMAFIPEGLFDMGAATNAGMEGYSTELPQHVVQTEAFYLDRLEVTAALWDEVAAWAATNGYDLGAASGAGPAHPVAGVTWYAAVKWCNARSERAGLTACYITDGAVFRTDLPPGVWCDWRADGFRLPTEAEWEKGARGGRDGHRFPWGDSEEIQHTRAAYYSFEGYSYDTSESRGFHPAAPSQSGVKTVAAGSLQPNAYGLHDMAGNVWEWCWDGYEAGYHPSASESSPKGVDGSSTRSLRGGGWCSGADGCRVAVRCGMAPSASSLYAGFRCARSIPAP